MCQARSGSRGRRARVVRRGARYIFRERGLSEGVRERSRDGAWETRRSRERDLCAGGVTGRRRPSRQF